MNRRTLNFCVLLHNILSGMIIIYEKTNKPTKKGNHLKRKTNNLICNLYTMEKPSHKNPTFYPILPI